LGKLSLRDTAALSKLKPYKRNSPTLPLERGTACSDLRVLRELCG
jgi:hypothetical protein